MRRLPDLDGSGIDTAATLVVADRIHTLDGGSAEAALIVGSRFAAVGTPRECLDAATLLGIERGRVIRADRPGATIVPGFVDPHAHPLMLGQMMTWVDCGPDRARSIPEIVALLRAAAADGPGDRPVRGYGYEQQNLVERRHPTRFELDAVSDTREVYLMNASGHGGVVNSLTLALARVGADTPNPPGGTFFRAADGDLTGEISDAACDILTGVGGVRVGNHGPNFHLADAPEEHVRQLRAAQDRFLAAGVTALGDCQVTRREFDTYLRLAERGGLHTRVSMYLLSHLLDETLEMGMHGAFGNARLAFAGIKLYVDGTLGGWTAYFPDGYVGDPCRTGQLYHEPAEYAELILRAHRAGLQTATHAQSPTAIGIVLDAIAAAQRAAPRPDARHRIEHCGLPDSAQIARMAELGVLPVSQPQHYYNWGEGVTAAIGTPGERFNPLGEFHRAGVPVTLSSDAPVANPLPLEAIQVAVTRRTRSGVVLGSSDLRVDVATALAGHTLAGARALGREHDLGSVTAGKRADLVVLGADPLSTEPEAISGIPVLETWIDGAPVPHAAATTEPALAVATGRRGPR